MLNGGGGGGGCTRAGSHFSRAEETRSIGARGRA